MYRDLYNNSKSYIHLYKKNKNIKYMKPKILFLHQSWKGFEKRDFEILKNRFLSTEILINKKTLYRIIYIIKEIKKSDIIFCWFAYRAAFIPLIIAKIFKKKIVLVMGGWNCANVPEINYGAMRSGGRFLLNRVIIKSIIRLTDIIIAVSKHNKKEIINNLGISSDRINLIYHGIPIDCCKEENIIDQKEKLVLSVGQVTETNLKRKGLETFIKAASQLPGVDFILVGRIDKDVKNYLDKLKTPKNLKITDFVNEKELHTFYRKAKVYVQVSYHEQFGCALAEAMVHKCVPIAVDRTALPEVVGNAGYYVPYGNISKTVEAIKAALKDGKKDEMARERILNLFPLEKREKSLVELINTLV